MTYSQPQAVVADSKSSQTNGTQYLTFFCAGEEYGIDIIQVLEIKSWDKVTRVPYAPSYVLGVMNLRGLIVPVINLRARFNLENKPRDNASVVILVKVKSSKGDKVVGILVDAVSEVYSILAETIKPPPEMCNNTETPFVTGIASIDGNKMVMILDTDAVFADFVHVNTPASLSA